MIGGALARPCISYPDIFARGTIWDRFPYLLPNLFSAATVFVGVVIGILFLDETQAVKRHRRDRGREMGDYIASRMPSLRRRARTPEKHDDDGASTTSGSASSVVDCSEEDELLPEYSSRSSSPRLAPVADVERIETTVPTTGPGSPGFKIFTKPVILNIISYGILAL